MVDDLGRTGRKRRLTPEKEIELEQCLQLRRKLTNKALAERFNLSESSINTYMRRARNRTNGTL